jgi:hypothetical protein
MRRITAALGLTLACGTTQPELEPVAMARPETVRYTPATVKYRAVQHRRVEQDLSGQTVANDLATTLFLSTELSGDPEGLSFRVVIDSVDLSGAAASSIGRAASAQGTEFTAILAPTGELTRFTGGDSLNSLQIQLASGLRRFFPLIPPDGVQPGSVWTDTTQSDVDVGGVPITVHSTNHHECLGWGEYAGEVALEVRTRAAYTLSGRGQQGGQDFTLEGTGGRISNRYLSADGRYLGAISADSSEFDVLLTSLGMTIPAKQRSADTLIVIR